MPDAPLSGEPGSRGAAGSGNAAPPPDQWLFGPPGAAVRVENADPLLPFLPYFLGGWQIRWAGATEQAGTEPAGAPDVRVIETGDESFRVISTGPGGADFAFDNPYDAANGLAGALISVHLARRAGTICLHAAASEIGDGLVVLLGDSFAGKSSVALHLAVVGNRFFGDDQIAVSLAPPHVGTCLGLMPKVRTPLPDDCGPAFREFVDGFTAMEGDGMVYLKLWEGEAGTFGDSAPVKALVFLDRREDGPADLGEASRAELMKSLVSTAFAPHVPSPDLLAGLTSLADTAALHRLRFSSSREAAALLSKTFR